MRQFVGVSDGVLARFGPTDPRNESRALPKLDPNSPELQQLPFFRTSLDPLVVAEVRGKIAAGEEVTPSQLQAASHSTSPTSRYLLRKAFTTVAAVARNQDLLLPFVEQALNGDPEARKTYAAERIILPENLPAWAKELWEGEANAPWRRFDLHGKAMRAFCKELRCDGVEAQFKEIYIEPSDRITAPVGDALLLEDPRAAIFTLSQSQRLQTDLTKDLPEGVKLTRSVRHMLADWQIRHGMRTFVEATPISLHFKRVAGREIVFLHNAFFLEDAAIAADIPLSSFAMQRLFSSLVQEPWALQRCSAWKHVATATSILRARGTEDAAVTAQLDTLVEDPKAMQSFLSAAFPKPSSQVAAPLSGSSPGKNQNNGTPALAAAINIPSISGNRESIIRRAIRSSIENNYANLPELNKTVKHIAKLVGSSQMLLKKVLNDFESKRDTDEIIRELRSKRPGSVLREKRLPTIGETSLENQERALIPDKEEEADENPTTFLFSSEVEEALIDGRLRHKLDGILNRYAENPALVDRKKIQTTTDVWEFRLLRENLRVYFFEPGEHTVIVLLIGSKEDQKFDVRRLEHLRQQELERFKGARQARSDTRKLRGGFDGAN